MGDWNTKFFQVASTIRKSHNYIKKIMDEHGNWLDDQNYIMQVFSQEFENRFKKDLNNNIQLVVSLCGVIFEEENA